MRPQRVCFPFMGRELGGSHFSARGLIRGIDRARYEPVLVFQHLDGPVFEHFRHEAAECVGSPKLAEFEPGQAFGPRAVAAALSGARALSEFLRGLRIDIVHCNDGRTNAVWSAPAKLAGAKLIWHNRGNPEARGLRFAGPFLPDRIISVSHFASPKPGFVSAAAKNDVVYSPFDVSLRVDRVAARARLAGDLGVPAETRFIGYFGLLIDRKRPLLFVETIAAIQRAAPDLAVTGLFFGEAYDGLAEKAKSLAASLGVGDRIRFMGFRTPGADWIAACDVLLVTAVDEPFGRTLIEAMIVGTPVVATASGGNIEAIADQETGLLAEAENAEALAAAVSRVLQDTSLAQRLAATAQTEARAKFGETRHVDAVMRIYDKVIGLDGDSESRGAVSAAIDRGNIR